MKIDIGAKVRTRDGHEIGKVERVVVNPSSKEVDGIVVHRGRVLPRDVVVPLSLVQRAGKDGLQLRIGMDRAEDLPDFVEAHYVKPSDRAITLPYAPGSMLFPLVPPYGVAGTPFPYEVIEEEREAPPEDVEITEGTEVRTVDGTIGSVDELLTDPQADRVSAILVRAGRCLTKDTQIPVEFVDEVASDHIKVSLTTDQVEALPEPTTDRYLTSQGRGRKRRKP